MTENERVGEEMGFVVYGFIKTEFERSFYILIHLNNELKIHSPNRCIQPSM